MPSNTVANDPYTTHISDWHNAESKYLSELLSKQIYILNRLCARLGQQGTARWLHKKK